MLDDENFQIDDTLIKVGNIVVELLNEDPVRASLPKNSWQISSLVEDSTLYLDIFLDYEILFENLAHELADPFLWIASVAQKVGGVSLRTGKLLIRDNKKNELLQFSQASLVFKCNENNAEERIIASCKVMDLINVLTSKKSEIHLEARIMGVMDVQ